MITMDTRFNEITALTREYPKLKEILDICLPEESSNWNSEKTIFDLGERNAYNAMISLNLILEELRAGKDVYFKIKEQTGIFLFERHPGNPWCFVYPAGGFKTVDLFHSSGIPIAVELDRQNYNIAVIRGTVGDSMGIKRLLEELAEGISLTIKMFPDAKKYALFGFSSGGMLAGLWGTEHVGYRCYNLPGPEVLICAFAPHSERLMLEFLDGRELSINDEKQFRQFLARAFGENACKEEILKYSTEALVTDAYPATYLIHGEMDQSVSIQHAEIMENALKEHNVACKFRRVADGGHNFGKGYHTQADGWLIDAVEFWKNQ